MRTVTIRLPEEIIKQIEAIQKKMERTKSKTYEILLRQGIEQEVKK